MHSVFNLLIRALLCTNIVLYRGVHVVQESRVRRFFNMLAVDNSADIPPMQYFFAKMLELIHTQR